MTMTQENATQIQGKGMGTFGWIFEAEQCGPVPEESTEEHPSPSDKLTPKMGQVKTPLMMKWNRVTEVGQTRLGKDMSGTINKYCIPVITQAQPVNHTGYSEDKSFSFFRYVSKREYLNDKDWNTKEAYFQEMHRSLSFAKMATSGNGTGQVSPTSSPVQKKSRLNNKPNSNKIIMLDLDETLVRAEPYVFGKSYNDIISVKVGEDQHQSFGVFVRPFTQEFLEVISRNHRLVVYTASVQEYAEKIVQVIDPNKQFFDQILSRQHCTFINGMFVKNLNIASQYGVQLENVIIVDNYVHSYALHLDQGIPIKPFYGSKDDRELVDLANMLHLTDDYPNLQDFLRSHFDFPKLYDFLEVNRTLLL